MFSIITSLKSEFNKGLDESKLKEFKRLAKTVNEEKLNEFCKEIHYIMQRHFTNEVILNECKELLKYIEEVVKLKEEIKNVKYGSYHYNTYVTKGFMTSWSYKNK